MKKLIGVLLIVSSFISTMEYEKKPKVKEHIIEIGSNRKNNHEEIIRIGRELVYLRKGCQRVLDHKVNVRDMEALKEKVQNLDRTTDCLLEKDLGYLNTHSRLKKRINCLMVTALALVLSNFLITFGLYKVSGASLF